MLELQLADSGISILKSDEEFVLHRWKAYL